MKDEHEEYYLRKKLEAIERRLKKKGDYVSNEMRKYLEKLEKGKYPTNVKKAVQEEIENFQGSNPHPNEISMMKVYFN